MAKKTNCVINGKDPRYRIRIRIGTNAKGNPVYKSFYGSGKAEAQEKADAYVKKQSKNPNANSNSFLQIAEYYTYQIMPHLNLAHGTVELYERQYRNIVSKQNFAIKPIAEIRRSDLQLFFNTLSAPPSVVQATHKFLRRLFRWMCSEGYCDNLMDTVAVKDVPRTRLNADISVFCDADVKQIINQPNRLHFLFFLAFATGMRLGEILAIRYSDFHDGTVTVSKQLNEHYVIGESTYHESSITEPKSSSSNRVIPLPPSAEKELANHRKWHSEEMMQNCYRTDFVFTSGTGHLLSKGNFRRAWQRHLKQCGIPYQKFHSCRATYCTMLCKNGVPLETASKLMGHSDVSVTAKYYRAVTDAEMRDAVSKIDVILSPVGDNLAIMENNKKKTNG